jgi:ATP-dependent helicase/nuclease subunit B
LLNPYEIFARWILNLKALDPLDAAPDARLRGTVFHLVLEQAMAALDGCDPTARSVRGAVHACINVVLEQCQIPPAQAVFWRARLGRILDWWLDREVERRGIWQLAASEAKGQLVLSAPGGAFEIVGKADRIDRHLDGSYEVMDYKTGHIPSMAAVKGLLKPQLLVEAAMLARGTIEGLPPGPTRQISYWRITGGSPAGERFELGEDIERLTARILARLEDWIAGFDVPDQPYLVYPADRRAPPVNDYSHLSRIAEWASGEGEGG